MKDPHLKARDMWVEIDHPLAGSITLPNFPIKFSETKGNVRIPAPLLGQYNKEVYSELLGYTYNDIEVLRKEGVI